MSNVDARQPLYALLTHIRSHCSIIVIISFMRVIVSSYIPNESKRRSVARRRSERERIPHSSTHTNAPGPFPRSSFAHHEHNARDCGRRAITAPMSLGAHASARLRFDDAAEHAVAHLAHALQWHRGSAVEGQFIAQTEARAGTCRACRARRRARGRRATCGARSSTAEGISRERHSHS